MKKRMIAGWLVVSAVLLMAAVEAECPATIAFSAGSFTLAALCGRKYLKTN